MGNWVTSGSQRSAVPRGPRKPLLSSGESGELQGTQSSPTSVAFKRTSQVRFPFSESLHLCWGGGLLAHPSRARNSPEERTLPLRDLLPVPLDLPSRPEDAKSRKILVLSCLDSLQQRQAVPSTLPTLGPLSRRKVIQQISEWLFPPPPTHSLLSQSASKLESQQQRFLKGTVEADQIPFPGFSVAFQNDPNVPLSPILQPFFPPKCPDGRQSHEANLGSQPRHLEESVRTGMSAWDTTRTEASPVTSDSLDVWDRPSELSAWGPPRRKADDLGNPHLDR